MVKLYSYKYDGYTIVTTDIVEAEESETGITGVMYGTQTLDAPKWQDEKLIHVGDIVYVDQYHNYIIEQILAC